MSTTLDHYTPSTFRFEGSDVSILDADGSPLIPATALATVLGHARTDYVSTAIARWADEFEEGVDFHRLKGEEASAVAASLATDGLSGASKRTSQMLILTEQGVNLYLMKSRAPKAKAFRRWLASEVLPALRKSGRYEATPPLAEVETSSERIEALRIARECVIAGRSIPWKRLEAFAGVKPTPPAPKIPANQLALIGDGLTVPTWPRGWMSTSEMAAMAGVAS